MAGRWTWPTGVNYLTAWNEPRPRMAASLLGEALRYLDLKRALAFEKQKNAFMMELAGVCRKNTTV